MLKPREILIYYSRKHEGDWRKIYNAVIKKEKFEIEDVIKANETLTSKVLTIFDDDYPKYFKQIPYSPFVIYYHGDLSILHSENKRLAVVGSRNNSEEGASITRRIVTDLDNDVTIVSGLAMGIDGVAHRAAISSNKKTVAVLGCGINKCYVTSNIDIYEEIKKNHLVISEYPEDIDPQPDNFPFRNRIIAVISQSILVTETKIPSGTLSTINYGLSLGRDIMCVPYFPDEGSGCNRLIQEGAILVENSKDVMEIILYSKLKKS